MPGGQSHQLAPSLAQIASSHCSSHKEELAPSAQLPLPDETLELGDDGRSLFNQPRLMGLAFIQADICRPPSRAHSAIYLQLGSLQAEQAGWGFLIVFKLQLAPLNCPGLSLCSFPNPVGKNNPPILAPLGS